MSMAASGASQDRVDETTHSLLLQIPPELRLTIYEFALLDSPCVTIGHAEVVGEKADVVHHLYGENRTTYSGLPKNHVPLITHTYNASLLSITQPATVPATSTPKNSTREYSAHESLVLVNKQIRSELTRYFQLPRNKETSIFTSYPYGLHILRNTAPRLLGQAKSFHLAGTYTPTRFRSCHAARTSTQPPASPPPGTHNANLHPNFPRLLGQLIASTFGPQPIYRVRKLEMRIYYPGDDSYSTVWGDDSSPTVVALRNISNAEVGIEVWRGRRGTGIYLCARPARERKRVVSTVWRRLEEGGRGESVPGSWVIDPEWPEWKDDYEASEGPSGNIITSSTVGAGDAGGASAS